MSDEYLIASFPAVRLTAHGEVRNAKKISHRRGPSCNPRSGNSSWIVLQPARIPSELNPGASSRRRKLLGQPSVATRRNPHTGAEYRFRSKRRPHEYESNAANARAIANANL